MNKHIKLVEKWLNDKDSVTQEELEQNKDAAYAAYAAAFAAYAAAAFAYAAAYADAAYAAADAAYAAYAAAFAAAADAAFAAYWVKEYYRLTGGEK